MARPPNHRSSRRGTTVPDWLIVWVVGIVMVMWVFSMGWSMFQPMWPVPPSVHAVVVLVVTGLMGTLALKGRNGGRNNDER